MENYNKPPKFSKEQVDWIKHSINNPNNLIKQAAELSSELIDDDTEDSLEDVEKNLEIIEKQSKNIADRVDLASKEIVSENEEEIKIKTPHAKSFIQKELEREIEMRYPLETNEIIELADLYGTDEESVVWVINKYEEKKHKEKEEDLTQFVKETLHNMNLSVDKPFPSFEEFYKKYEELFGGEDDYLIKNDLKKKFEELISNPKQLKLFEIRSVIRKFLFEVKNKKK